jgi:D-amino-acid oxidase
VGGDGDTGIGVAVVGAGVIGLTCALELARAGHRVQVLTADPVEATTSAVAAAIVFPYRAAPPDVVLRWVTASLPVFTGLAADPATGVTLRPGLMVHRTSRPDLSWTAAVPGHRPARPEELPPGASAGTRCTLPIADTTRYLGWLSGACRTAGVEIVLGRVASLTEVPGDVVVVAAGLRSGALMGDDTLVPVQGQVVRVADPGLPGWLIDEHHPAGLTFAIPRAGGDVVCGGTAVEGSTCTEPDPDVETAILARVRAVLPQLQDARVLSRAVGLRPGRPTVRLDRTDVDGRPVICCYGHGGAGVTLSWGCAADVVGLVRGEAHDT